MKKLDSEVFSVLNFLKRNPAVRMRISAPPNKTVVYSGGISCGPDAYRAWQQLSVAKRQDPVTFDCVTLEERLRTLHVTQFGETLFEHANRISRRLTAIDERSRSATILWRALSGIYVAGAVGKVRALVRPDEKIGESVFALTEVRVLLRPAVLERIDVDAALLRDFNTVVRSGLQPAPLVVF